MPCRDGESEWSQIQVGEYDTISFSEISFYSHSNKHNYRIRDIYAIWHFAPTLVVVFVKIVTQVAIFWHSSDLLGPPSKSE